MGKDKCQTKLKGHLTPRQSNAECVQTLSRLAATRRLCAAERDLHAPVSMFALRSVYDAARLNGRPLANRPLAREGRAPLEGFVPRSGLRTRAEPRLAATRQRSAIRPIGAPRHVHERDVRAPLPRRG